MFPRAVDGWFGSDETEGHDVYGGPAVVWPADRLFWKTDCLVMGWNTLENAHELASKLLETAKPAMALSELQTQIGWDRRKLNPAATYLVHHGLVEADPPDYPPILAYSNLKPTRKTKRLAEDSDMPGMRHRIG